MDSKGFKTVRDYLASLPSPYSYEAINNSHKIVLDQPAENVKQALTLAFIWSASPQKKAYWLKVYTLLIIDKWKLN